MNKWMKKKYIKKPIASSAHILLSTLIYESSAKTKHETYYY